MKIIRVPKSMFYDRCRERNIDPEKVKGCIAAEHKHGLVSIDIEHPDYPRPTKNSAKIVAKNLSSLMPKGENDKDLENSYGVGTELKKLLSYINITSSPNCSCTSRARAMNEKGIHWCKNNKEIIIGWLEEEAKKRKLPFIRYAASKILDLAIYRAEKKLKK